MNENKDDKIDTSTDDTNHAIANCVVIGAMKSGTTALARRFDEHPEIYVAPIKETHFFAEDELYAGGISEYAKYFSTYTNESAIVDLSPSYSRSKRYPDAAKRLAKAIPNAKIIYILRDPIARMESHWIEARRGGWPVPPFNEAVFSDTDILSSSCYWSELNMYREHYSDDNILVLFTEELHKNPEDLLRRCYEFLQVDSNFKNPGLGQIERQSEGAYIDKDWTARYLRTGLGKMVGKLMPRKIINILRPLVRLSLIHI